MKVLFDNLILSATLSALHASLNYPVANIQDSALKKRFQSTYAADTVTASFTADKTIDCVYYGFTNAAGIVILLKNAGGSTLKTITIATPDAVTGAEHFIAVGSVRSVDVQLTKTGVGVYLGGLAAGVEVSFPDPLNAWEEPRQDNSSFSGSPDGQYNQTYIKPLRAYSWTFSELTRDEANALASAYEAVGVGANVWADPFEENHDFMAPLYCVLAEPIAPAKADRRYSITLSIAEAR